MKVKKPIQTKFRMPVFNWVALKPSQIDGTVFTELNDEKVLQVRTRGAGGPGGAWAQGAQLGRCPPVPTVPALRLYLCPPWRLEQLRGDTERSNMGSVVLLLSPRPCPLAPSSSSHPVHGFFLTFILWSPHPLLTHCLSPCPVLVTSLHLHPVNLTSSPCSILILSLLSPLSWSSGPILIPDVLCHLPAAPSALCPRRSWT